MNKEKICPVCSKTFNWSIIRKKQQVTCSRECSNSFFKRRTAKNPTKYNCIVCNKESKIHYGKHAKNLYCSNECYVKNKNQETKKRFNNGELRERDTLRKLISEEKGYKCNMCGISDWNEKPITLQVNHIDGNCTNNMPYNLEIICPNCHTQTSTFGGRNKGNGRVARGLPRHY